MNSSNVIREIGFGIVFTIVVVLIIGFVFYEFIPSKVVPEPESYSQAATTTKLLSQIKEEQQAEQQEKNDEVLKSYAITSEDLSYSSDTEYVKGKNHPFYDYTSVKTADSGTSSAVTDAPSNSGINSTIIERGGAVDNTSSNTNTTNTSSNTTNTNTSRIDTSSLRDKSDQNKISK